MSAFFWGDLIFQLDHSSTGFFILTNGADDIDDVAKSGICITDCRDFNRLADVVGTVEHLRHSQQTDVGLAEMASCLAITGHIHCRKAYLLNNFSGQRIMSAGSD